MYRINDILAVFCYFLSILRITMQSCTLIFQIFFKKCLKKIWNAFFSEYFIMHNA